eukprot:7108048-Pyramimonas_sp.AAC.1
MAVWRAYVGQVVDGGGGGADLALADWDALPEGVIELHPIEAHVVSVPPRGGDGDLKRVPAWQQRRLKALWPEPTTRRSGMVSWIEPG